MWFILYSFITYAKKDLACCIRYEWVLFLLNQRRKHGFNIKLKLITGWLKLIIVGVRTLTKTIKC